MTRLAVLLGLTALNLVGCATPEKREVEQAGYRSAAPVIAAIDKFRTDHGRYPDRLQELVPRYLPRVRQIAVADIRYGDLQGFQYYPQRDRYGLNFVYYSSNGNSNWRCYDSQTKKWEPVVITW